jgi:hypothetical protein
VIFEGTLYRYRDRSLGATEPVERLELYVKKVLVL